MEVRAVGGDYGRLSAAIRGLERTAHSSLHRAICDACGGLILGTRYRCADCIDFDLCTACLCAPTLPATVAAAPGVSNAGHRFDHRMLEIFLPFEKTGRWAEHVVFAEEMKGPSRKISQFRQLVHAGGADGSEGAINDRKCTGDETANTCRAGCFAKPARVVIRRMTAEDLPGVAAIENICFLEPYDKKTFSDLQPMDKSRERPSTLCSCFVATVEDDDSRLQRVFVARAESSTPHSNGKRSNLEAAGAVGDSKTGVTVPPDSDSVGNGIGANAVNPNRSPKSPRKNLIVAGYVLVINCGRPTALIASIATRPDFRGQGVAQALMQQALYEAKSQGSSRCRLHVLTTNTGAQRLYRRCGFSICRELPGYYRPSKDGLQQSGDAFLMVHHFSGPTP